MGFTTTDYESAALPLSYTGIKKAGQREAVKENYNKIYPS